MSININAVGNLTADPELRFTPSGAAVANLTVAVQQRKKSSAGEWEDDGTTFLRVTVWNQYAENVAESLHKGDRVTVSGKFRAREYDRKDGGKGISLEVAADEIGPSLRWATAEAVRNSNGSRRA